MEEEEGKIAPAWGAEPGKIDEGSSSSNSNSNNSSSSSNNNNNNSEGMLGMGRGVVEGLGRRMRGLLDAVPKRHHFWETQPVGQYTDRGNEELAEGSIEPPKPLSEVRKEPYNLPKDYEWCTCDINSAQTMTEVYTLLTNNYVEDDDNMFRFDYSVQFLLWALRPPGYFPEWHIGVRVKNSKRLVAFISGVPAKIRVKDEVIRMAEINFLCVHKKLRSKRLAPVLIKEVTRRVHLRDMWHAAYTAGVVLPTPITTCQYWHRSLNPKKLIDVGFSRLGARLTMSRTVKLYKLPTEVATAGFREMERRDVKQVTALLNEYLKQFSVAPSLSNDDVEYWMLPVSKVIYSYVVQQGDRITDFCSFYSLPSTVIGNEQHSSLQAAYSFYNVAACTPAVQLMNDALIMAKNNGFDVFNALDIMHNQAFLKELKFGPGDGHLHYYLYNYRLKEPLKPSELGLVLL